MIDYGLERGVKLMAYAYPVLPFMGDGAEPIDGAGWLYRQHNGRGQPAVARPAAETDDPIWSGRGAVWRDRRPDCRELGRCWTGPKATPPPMADRSAAC